MSTREFLLDAPLFSGEAPELAPPLKVSELVALLKRDVEHKHRHVRVVGELASFKPWHSGHWYFDIKDEGALIPAVMFKMHAARVPFKVSDGQKILFTGKVSVYQANARLQMVVEGMEPLGQGALALAFLQLKERLSKEGLFELSQKKEVKLLNNTIGIVTSSHGAALRDMLKIIKSRLPGANILLAAVRVQGTGAKEEIAMALKLLDQSATCDVIIVGRGGGSLEDLWAFNEELVARVIFEAKTPIISAVGHETDTTISDFVADLRAATPTHGAMLAAASLSELQSELSQSAHALHALAKRSLSKAWLELFEQKKSLGDPRILLFRHWQRLDELQSALEKCIARDYKAKRSALDAHGQQLQSRAPWRTLRAKKELLFSFKAALEKKDPKNRLELASLELERGLARLHELISSHLSSKRESFIASISKLEALSPLSVLRRGFSLISEQKSGKLVSACAQLKINDSVSIRLHDGVMTAVISGKE